MTNHKLIQQLIDAVTKNNPKKVNRLLNSGIDPNETLDDDQITPLHYAAQHNAIEVIPLLIAAGADIEARTAPDNYTPLDIAIMHEHYKIANLLLMYQNQSQNYQ